MSDVLDKYYPDDAVGALNDIISAMGANNVELLNITLLCASTRGGCHQVVAGIDPVKVLERPYEVRWINRDLAIYLKDVVWDHVGKKYLLIEYPPRIVNSILG